MSAGDAPLRAGAALPADAYAEVRRELVLRACKWDPQVGDASTLCPFPLLLPASEWRRLASAAEAMTREVLAAEAEVLASPRVGRWLRRLGLPRKLRRALQAAPPPPAAGRVFRYDFHWTRDGWRVSEANADVPGGYAESSAFPRLVAARLSGVSTAGEPLERWAAAVAAAAGALPVALLSAPGYMEDHQVVSALARALQAAGVVTHLAQPRHLRWRAGRAHLLRRAEQVPLGAVARFFQAEWLDPDAASARPLLCGGLTPVSNPGAAVVAESKRFPLLWDELRTPLPTWRALLPETRDPREAPWRRGEAWVLKAALSNNGDAVLVPGAASPRAWRAAAWQATLHPGAWVAQRRFEAVALETPLGPRFPCLGVYTVDGRAVGIYGRLGAAPVIDYAASDVAVLLDGRGEEASA